MHRQICAEMLASTKGIETECMISSLLRIHLSLSQFLPEGWPKWMVKQTEIKLNLSSPLAGLLEVSEARFKCYIEDKYYKTQLLFV